MIRKVVSRILWNKLLFLFGCMLYFSEQTIRHVDASTVCQAGTYGKPWEGETCTSCPGAGKECPHNSTVPVDCPPGYYCPDLQNSVPKVCNCTVLDGTDVDSNSCGTMTGPSIFDCDNSTCVLDSVVPADLVQWIGGTGTDGNCEGETCLWTDYKVESTIRLHESQGNYNIAGLFLRSTHVSASQLYGYHLSISYLQRQVRLEALVGGWSMERTWGGSAAMVEKEKDHNLTVLVTGSQLVAYLDGEFIFEKADLDFFSAGTIGLYSYRQPATWKNIRVTQLSCKIACPRGTFKSISGQSDLAACVDCASVTNVEPGQFFRCGTTLASSRFSEICPVGAYCPGGHPNTTAVPIPCINTTSIAGSDGVEDCTPCQPGYDCSTDGTSVVPCPKGFYCPLSPIRDDPIPCPIGTFSDVLYATDESACKACETGYFGCTSSGMAAQTPCLVGHYCPSNNTQPVQLDPPTCGCKPVFEGSCEPDGLTTVADNWIVPAWNKYPTYDDDGNLEDYQLVLDDPNFFLEGTRWLGGNDAGVCTTASCRWRDFKATFKFMMYDPIKRRLGFHFRQQRAFPQNSFVLTFLLSAKPPVVAFSRFISSKYVDVASVDYPLATGVEYNVTLDVHGNVFDAYINNEFVLSYTDAELRYEHGTVGITSALQMGHFRDIYISGPGIPCDTGMNSPQVCPPGTFQNETMSTDCRVCPPGTQCTLAGVVNPTPCIAGHSCAGGRAMPEPCALGMYGFEGICYPCQAGTFGNATGLPECIDAPLGAFVNDRKATEYSTCPLGTYSDRTGATQCTPCPINTYVGVQGATDRSSCLPCGTDKYSRSGSSVCQKCDGDHFTASLSMCQENNMHSIVYSPDKLCEATTNPKKSMDIVDCSHIPQNSQIGLSILACISVSTAINILIVLGIGLKWENPLVKASQRGLSIAINIGAAATNLSLLTTLGGHSTIPCMLRDPLLHLFLVFMLGNYFAKVKRVYLLFSNLSLDSATNGSTMKPALIVFGVELLVIAIWLFAGPNKVVDEPIPTTRLKISEAYCSNCTLFETVCKTDSVGSILSMVSYVVLGCLITACCYMSWVSRKLPDSFSEARTIAIGMYNIAATFMFLAFLENGMVLAWQSKTLLWVIGVAWMNSATTVVIYGYKFYRILTVDPVELKKHIMNEIMVAATTTNNSKPVPSNPSAGSAAVAPES